MSLDRVLRVFTYPFVQRALIVGILIAFCAALLGVILVLKRYSLIGYGLSNVGFASLSLALALQWSPLYVAIPIVVIAAFLIMIASQKSINGGDVSIGIVATTALAIGSIITSLARGFNIDVSSYMFGSILAMSSQDVILSLILGIVVVVLFVLFYNRLFLITYDESYAKSTGINVTFYQFLISFLTALTVVLGMRMMGTLLISGLIILPAVTAMKLVRSFKAVVITAGMISVICFVMGILVSFMFNFPTGPSIVIVNVVLMFLATIFGGLIRK